MKKMKAAVALLAAGAVLASACGGRGGAGDETVPADAGNLRERQESLLARSGPEAVTATTAAPAVTAAPATTAAAMETERHSFSVDAAEDDSDWSMSPDLYAGVGLGGGRRSLAVGTGALPPPGTG